MTSRFFPIKNLTASTRAKRAAAAKKTTKQKVRSDAEDLLDVLAMQDEAVRAGWVGLYRDGVRHLVIEMEPELEKLAALLVSASRARGATLQEILKAGLHAELLRRGLRPDEFVWDPAAVETAAAAGDGEFSLG